MQKLFIVEKKEPLTQKDGLYLRNLYQPLIGAKATMLYHLFIDYYYLNKVYRTFFNLNSLGITLNLNHQKLQLAMQKLEAVGLIRTFVKTDQKHFLIALNRPLSIEKFIRNSFLYKLLIDKIGHNMFERIAFAFKKSDVDKTSFNEVSAKFHDIFSIDKINPDNSTLELNFPIINSKDEAIKNLMSSQFVSYLTNQQISMTLLKTINEINQLGFSSHPINLMIEYSFEVNGKIINNHIKKIARNLSDKGLFDLNEIKQELLNAKRNKLGYKDNDLNEFELLKTNFNQSIQETQEQKLSKTINFINPNLKSNSEISNSEDNWQFFLNSLGEN